MPPSTPPLLRYEDVLYALNCWRKGRAATPLSGLALHQQARQQLGPCADERALNEHVLLVGLARLAEADGEAARLLRRRFQEGETQQAVANALHCSVPHLGRLQRDAVKALAVALEQAEQNLRAAATLEREKRWANLRLRLDLTAGHDRLFGVDDQQEALRERLARPGPPHLLLVEGLGGIGKTALAAAVLRQILDEDVFDDVAWVTAQQRRLLFSGEVRPIYDAAATVGDVITDLAEQVLPEAEQPLPFTPETVLPPMVERLHSQRTLLVVDNLESIAEVETLLPVLRTLAGPAKVLLTSRVYPHSDAPMQRLVLPELARPHADQLVVYLADLAGIDALAAADEATLAAIYATLGGNPLALRLLVGQCHRHSPAAVLQALRQAQGCVGERLYTFIYRHAWDALDEPARDLLLALALIPPEGAEQSYIVASSGLDPDTVHDGLALLVDLNLVEHRMNRAGQSRYAIHSLTRTFLHTQILA